MSLEKLNKNLCSQLSSAPPEVPPRWGASGPLGNSKEKLKESQEVSIRDNPYGSPLVFHWKLLYNLEGPSVPLRLSVVFSLSIIY